MTYVRKHGHPDLFITFTCNPKWNEIEKELLRGQTATDRPDLVDRVFKLKLNQMVELVTKKELFGPAKAFMYTVEFQKRGLPHAHMLLWLQNSIRPTDIDRVICAEIPDKNLDPELYEIVMKNMVHGPCGKVNMNSPCMKDKKCTKKYPKDFLQNTRSDQEGYPLYRRRKLEDGGREAVIVRGRQIYDIDNSHIVPYNPMLLKIFKAHINVELCTSIKAIKYVCKYICKGQDMLSFELKPKIKNANDETEIYQLARYISAPEAVWRILAYDIHEHSPGVDALAVHLPNQRVITFDPTSETSESVQNRPEKESTLEAFFTLCNEDPDARELLYAEVPEHYIWKSGKWVKRKTKEFKLGRVYSVHPSQMEAFCLRLLLFKVRGPKSYEDLRTVEHITNEDDEDMRTVERITYDSFQEACRQLGLLEDDHQYNQALIDASFSESAKRMRDLFCYIITACPDVKDRLTLWNNHKDEMSDDLLYEEHETGNPNAEIHDVHNKCLIEIEDKILQISGKDLSEFAGLPIPNRDVQRISIEEKRETYDMDTLNDFVNENEGKLTEEQRAVYDNILANIDKGGFWFLDAPGGTGKTFLTKLILANVRKNGHKALAVASSGIAATLLPGGRTAHSTFKLPLDLASDDMPTCNVTRNGPVAALMKKVRLVVWDECTMSHKHAFEAVKRMMQDVIEGKPQLWKVDSNSELTDQADRWKSDDKWVFVQCQTLWYIKNITRNMFLTATKDGMVSLQRWAGEKKSQLWSKGHVNPEGYFHLKSANTMRQLTSTSAGDLEVKDQCNDDLFGGVLFLLTGDFRQILPVVPGGTKANELDASVKSSVLWEKVNTLHLEKNMRVHLSGDPEAEDFAKTLLEIGNGELGMDTNGIIGFPPHVAVNTKKELIQATFPNLLENYKDEKYISERAILAPKLLDVETINNDLIEKIPETVILYKSFNKVVLQVDATKYPVEFLETLNPSGKLTIL